MNILLIGNGFDLAHGLKTTYTDFLDFVSQVKSNVHSCDLSEEEFSEVKNYLENNAWVTLFQQKRKNIGGNWIDFEKEVSNVIQFIEGLIGDATKVNSKGVRITYKEEYEHFFENLIAKNVCEDQYILNHQINKFINQILLDLNDLIKALEIYLYNIATEREVMGEIKANDIIKEIQAEYVISFNYTDTYTQIYENPKIDYIHGKADVKTPLNNMVLGIEEYLDDSEKNKNLAFIRFKKYFQRIQKRTGCDYKNKLKKLKESSVSANEYARIHGSTDSVFVVNLHIFGHSLSVTDGDILKELISCEFMKTTIYYYDEEAYAQYIVNLVQILGQDELTAMVYGDNPQIVFKPTQPVTELVKELQNT